MSIAEDIARAIALHRSGQVAEAEQTYLRVLAVEPENPDALHLLGVIRHQQKDYASAEPLYRRAVKIQPLYTQAWMNLGQLMFDMERRDEALLCFRNVLLRKPADVAALHMLGRTHAAAGDLAAAEEAYRRALEAAPAAPEIWNNLGTVLARRGDRGAAEDAFRSALRHRPAYVSPLVNLGTIFREEGKLEEAAHAYRQALALDPKDAQAHWGLSHVLLVRGEFAQGWKEYEWRWLLAEHPGRPELEGEQWQGEPCGGKRITLYAEQGLGDAIQFVRYVPMLAERGARVTLLVPAPLVRLFRSVAGAGDVRSSDAGADRCDFQCSLLSLPGISGTEADNIPSRTPYMQAPPAVHETWRQRCEEDGGGFRIGLAWAGSSTHTDDARRSIGPRLLDCLQGIGGIRVYSLQLHDGSGGTAAVKGSRLIIDYTALLEDVAETAGLIEQMDLVITVDTMVAHLAGALGKRVWVLLPFAPDWRWLLDRSDSPWYPDARLFRQTSEGDWEEVFTRVRSSLLHAMTNRNHMNTDHTDTDRDLSAAITLHERGEVALAETAYRAALQTDPGNWEAQYLLAVARFQQNDFAESISLAREVTRTRPFFPEGYNALGNSLWKSGALADAESAFRKAIALRPEYADAHYNLGSCLCDGWRLQESADELHKALKLEPDFAQAMNNLGLVRYRQGDITEGMQYFQQAIAQRPEFTDAHWNLAHALLHTGRYAAGWKEFEWRWRLPAFSRLGARFQRPRWHGEDLRGRRLLVWSEQGFGDTLQFIRFLPGLRAQGCEIICECHAGLAPLVKSLPGITVVARGEEIPDHDLQIPLLSIPAALGWHDIPRVGQPYLHAADDGRRPWKSALAAAGERLRVGVVWSGSPTNPGGRFRAVPMQVFERLHDVGNVFFVNMQTGEAGRSYVSSGFGKGGGDWSGRLADFGTTAALIAELDLVVTIDTAAAHLAGALGAQVWVLLSKACDWRWGAAGRSTPWYNSARLYRQQTQEVWDGVIEDVRRDLTLLAGQICVPWSVRETPVVRAQMTQFDPVSFASWNNLGVALLEAGHAGEALAPFQQAVALEPENARGHVNLAHAQLVEGQWHDGLENLEWRLKTEEGSPALRPYTQPRWSGQPLGGKTVFLYAEQGFGDVIQFIRYAWLLAQSGGRVVVEVRRELARLMQRAPGVSGVVVRGEEPPAFHYHSPLLSLPFAFRTTPATVPSRTPYLIAGNEQLLDWKKKMEIPPGNRRIGICWSGNARFASDAERSISAEMICATLPQTDVVVYPLVKGGGTYGCPSNVDSGRWRDRSAELTDFADTAALLSYLDAVVTVDTAVAHLAGALARPVFLLLPFAPDWRWLSAGATTPWYPGMRLFRQTTPGSWDEPLQRVRIALADDIHRAAEQDARADADDSGDRHG